MHLAISSREGSEYLMPSVPMLIPSLAVGNPHVCGIAPAARNALTARSTKAAMPALQGNIVE
jgi:hypothetical protein